MHVDEMTWPGGDASVAGVGFPEDGSADFHCLLADRGRLSDIVHVWSHESRAFEPVKPWLGARAEGASWSARELWEESPVSRWSGEEGSSTPATPRERAATSSDALILAARIEEGALRGRADWEALLAPFIETTGASMSLQELRALGESDPASLVQRLLPARPPAIDPRPPSRDELVTLVARAHEHGLDPARAAAALIERSELPPAMAEQLATGSGQLLPGWPSAAHIVDFALSYRTPCSASDVVALAHAWAAETARGEVTCSQPSAPICSAPRSRGSRSPSSKRCCPPARTPSAASSVSASVSRCRLRRC